MKDKLKIVFVGPKHEGVSIPDEMHDMTARLLRENPKLIKAMQLRIDMAVIDSMTQTPKK